MHGINIKNIFPFYTEKGTNKQNTFYSRGCVWKFIGFGISNIIKFKSEDTEKFTNCLQGIILVWIFKMFL
jgi:hypothetical protein